MAEKATQRSTGKTSSQAFWFTGLVVVLMYWPDGSFNELLVPVKAGVLAEHPKPDGLAWLWSVRIGCEPGLHGLAGDGRGENQERADILQLGDLGRERARRLGLHGLHVFG